MNILLRDRTGEIAFNAFFPDNTPLATHVTDLTTTWEDKGERTADETPIFAFCDAHVETAYVLDPEGIKSAQESPESVEATARLQAANANDAIAEVVIPNVATELEGSIQANAAVANMIAEGAPDGKSEA